MTELRDPNWKSGPDYDNLQDRPCVEGDRCGLPGCTWCDAEYDHYIDEQDSFYENYPYG